MRGKKKKLLLSAVGVILVIIAVFVWREYKLEDAQQEFTSLLASEEGNYNENKVVLSSTTKEEAQEMADAFGGKLRITANGKFAVITLPDGMNVSDIAEKKEFRKYHDKIQLDYHNFGVQAEETEEKSDIRANCQVDDPMYPQQVYMDYLNIGNSWNTTRGKREDGSKVKVAVIDTGIDTDHPEFYDADGNSIISQDSYDATTDRTVAQNGMSVIEDENGHGTAVAGIIAAQMNSQGIAGLAPDVELLIIKCEVNEAGEFKSSADITFAIYYAIEQNADVINMSLSGVKSGSIGEALQLAVDSDIIPVAGAGNDSTAEPHYPAAYETTIGVGALADGSWEIAGYSDYGINTDIMAPGTALTTAAGGGYSYKSGTSIATPMVSAAAALYKANHKYAGFDEVKECLLAAGKDLGDAGEDYFYGYGALDMNAFLCEEKGTITYDYCTDELKETKQVFVRKHTIQTVPEPERASLMFDDWYYDKAYTQVFDYDTWYSIPFVEDVTLYAKWVNEDDEDASVYEYENLENGSVKITKYKGKRRYLTIPSAIDGKNVTAIGSGAFYGNSRLKEVVLPENLESIQEKAFSGCSNLRKVTFKGNALKEIQKEAFLNCRALRTVSIPDTVEKLGTSAFSGCTSLLTVKISENSSLREIGEMAFENSAISYFYIPKEVTASGFNGSALANCKKMRRIEVHPESSAFNVTNNVLFSMDKTSLVYYPAGVFGSYKIPDGIRTIGAYAFSSASISEVDLNTVSEIQSHAFAATSKLVSVVLPETLTELGESAFEGAAISQVTLSGNLKSIPKSVFSKTKLVSVHIGAKVQTICDAAFADCKSLKTLTFDPNTELKMIEGGSNTGAFSGCSSLTDFTLPDSLEVIGEHAFYGCSAVQNLIIPVKVNRIGESAFQYCTGLETVSFADGCELQKISKNSFANCIGLKTVRFSNEIRTLENAAFANCNSLETLQFSDGSMLETVEDSCFYADSSLKTMQLPKSVTSIGEFAYTLSGLQSAEISEDVTNIGAAAFGACYDLKELVVNENNTVYASLDNVLFNKENTVVYCVPSGRKGVYSLPETVHTMAPYSFYHNQYLKLVSLPESLQEIQNDAFSYCTSLQKVVIPDSVTSIGRYAFAWCYALNSVSFGENSQLKRLGMDSFVGCGFSEITIPASVEEMAQYVFENCYSLRSITFAKGSKLSEITAYMFTNTTVENIVFEAGSQLKSLQAHALDGAAYLKNIDFGDAQLEKIDNYAFYNCSKLEKITLPETVTYIGRYAFYGCASMSRIDIPAAVDFIGTTAFYGTNSIKVYFKAAVLPEHLEEGWDKGIAGYFLESQECIVTDDWEYTINSQQKVSLIRYKGNAEELKLDTLDGYIIEKVGTKCFYGNTTLKKVTLGENVKELGNYAFADTEIQVVIPENSVLNKIGEYAFSGNVTEKISLPDSVTIIGNGAFKDSALQTISIGKNSELQTIGELAFYNTNISEVYLPAKLSEVGAEAFKNVETLQNAEIADGSVKLKLNNSAFEGCGISEITIPARVFYIGEYTFGSCPNLQNISVDDDNSSYTSIDGVLCSSTETTLLQYPCGKEGAYAVPEQIKVLTYESFKNASKLTEISFGKGSKITTIGVRTFSGCSALKKINIPDSVVSIDMYAFENCQKLSEVIFGEQSQLTGVYEGAFYGCRELNQIMLPDGILEIGEYAFYQCSSLQQVPFTSGSQIRGIYDYAFAECGRITEIPSLKYLAEIGEYAFSQTGIAQYTVPATVTDISATAFDACEKFAYIGCEDANEEYVSVDGALYKRGADGERGELVIWPYANELIIGEGKSEITRADTEILRKDPGIRWKIAESVTVIGEKAFFGCAEIKSITIPEGITRIGKEAFSVCSSLEEVHFNAVAVEDLTSYNYVFEDAGRTGPGIVLTIGKSVSKIPAYMFSPDRAGSAKIIQLKFEENSVCQEIGACAFEENKYLKKIVLPESISQIDESAFEYCEKVKNIDIGNGVTDIGERAFFQCSNAESIMIGKNVKNIGSAAFDVGGKLKNIYFNATEMNDLSPDNTIFTGGYSGIENITVTIGANVQKIPAYLFAARSGVSSGTAVRSVVFEKGSVCEKIGKRAFDSCSWLAQVIIPESVSCIEEGAFSGTPAVILFENDKLPQNLENDWSGNAQVVTNVKAYGATQNGFYYYSVDGKNAVVHGYAGNEKDVIVPEKVNGLQVKEITRMFSSNSEIQTVAISEGIETIGENTFANCQNLQGVYIPKSVSTIKKHAVSERTLLMFESSELPADLEEDWNWAAEICLNVKKYGTTENGFFYCINGDNEAIIGRYTGKEKEVAVPNKIGTVQVKKIANYAFYLNTELKSVSIPEGISIIGEEVFYGCQGLEKVTIPSTVTKIGKRAFYGCELLKSINIPQNVVSIREEAFGGCTALTIFVEGTELPQNCGDNWSGNATVMLNVKKQGATEQGILYYITGQNTAIIGKAPENITEATIPEEIEGVPVVEIANSAFENCAFLTKAVMPENLEIIGSSAFKDCISLKEIAIPKGVREIKEDAFYNCSGANKIYFNAEEMEDLNENKIVFAYVGSETDGAEIIIGKDVKRIPDYLFYARYGTKGADIVSLTAEKGSVCTEIGAYAFEKRSKLKKVVLPETLTTIGNRAFTYCENLSYLYMPQSVVTIRESAFYGCNGLKTAGPAGGGYDYEFEWGQNIPDYAFEGCGNLENVVLKEGTEKIGAWVFAHSGIHELTLPNSVNQIGNSAFFSCSQLEKFEISENITSIGSSVFQYCSNLKKVIISKNLEKLGGNLFDGCKNLKTAGVIGSGSDVEFGWDEEIPANAFAGSEFETVVIPEGITAIGNRAFDNCSALKVIKLPESLRMIGRGCFSGCSRLPMILIPEKVESIGARAFEYCNTLSILFESSSLPENLGEEWNGWNGEIEVNMGVSAVGKTEDEKFFYFVTKDQETSVFQYNGNEEEIVIPDQMEGHAVNKLAGGLFYQNTTLTKITIPDSVTAIGNNAFWYCSNLKEIDLPEKLAEIGEDAFFNCSSLCEVTLPESVTKIGRFAFDSCTSLKKINIPNGVTELLQGTFYDCSSLKEVTLSENLKTMDQSAFHACTSLEQIELPESLKSLGFWTFYHCSSLKKITLPKNMESCWNSFVDCTDLELVQVESPTIAKALALNGDYEDLFQYVKTFVFPNSIQKIGDDVLNNYAEKTEFKQQNTEYTAYSNHVHQWKELEESDYVECQKDGNIMYSCQKCGLEKAEWMPAHDFGTPVYTWSEDNSTVTAKRVCSRNAQHIDEETVNTVEKEVTAPTCTQDGQITYEAEFKNEAFKTQTKTAAGEKALGHDFQNGVCTRCHEKRTGKWIKDKTRWWYRYSDGSYPKDELCKINNVWYGFDADGWMQKGWQKISDVWYYFKETGEMQTGWLLNKGTWYYLNSDGSMAKGWNTINKSRYYFKENGAMQKGWLSEKGIWYYLNSDGSMARGWITINNARYYLKETGEMQTGWLLYRGTWYYLNPNGSMAKGWITINSARYYLKETGEMQKGWLQDQGNDYYLNKDGKMQKGWQKVDNTWYYMDKNGVVQKSKWIDGIFYVKEDGSMAVSEWVDQNRYYVDANGVWVKDKEKGA